MKKLNYQSIRCLMALALLLMPLGILAQDEHEQHVNTPDLWYRHPKLQTIVTEWSINWSARTSASYPQLDNPYQLLDIH